MFKASIVEEASENCGQKVTAACCDDSSKNPKEAYRRRLFGLGGPRGVLKQQTGTRSQSLKQKPGCGRSLERLASQEGKAGVYLSSLNMFDGFF